MPRMLRQRRHLPRHGGVYTIPTELFVSTGYPCTTTPPSALEMPTTSVPLDAPHPYDRNQEHALLQQYRQQLRYIATTNTRGCRDEDSFGSDQYSLDEDSSEQGDDLHQGDNGVMRQLLESPDISIVEDQPEDHEHAQSMQAIASPACPPVTEADDSNTCVSIPGSTSHAAGIPLAITVPLPPARNSLPNRPQTITFNRIPPHSIFSTLTEGPGAGVNTRTPLNNIKDHIRKIFQCLSIPMPSYSNTIFITSPICVVTKCPGSSALISDELSWRRFTEALGGAVEGRGSLLSGMEDSEGEEVYCACGCGHIWKPDAEGVYSSVELTMWMG